MAQRLNALPSKEVGANSKNLLWVATRGCSFGRKLALFVGTGEDREVFHSSLCWDFALLLATGSSIFCWSLPH